MANLWNAKSPKTTSSQSITSSSASAAYNEHPPTQSTKNRIGGCHISLAVRSRPMPTPHLLLLHTSAIRLHTSSFLQLFIHHQTYGHTFPITEKASEPKVHEVSRYSRILRIIEPSHFSLLFLVSLALDGFPIEFPSRLIFHHAMTTKLFFTFQVLHHHLHIPPL